MSVGPMWQTEKFNPGAPLDVSLDIQTIVLSIDGVGGLQISNHLFQRSPQFTPPLSFRIENVINCQPPLQLVDNSLVILSW